MPARRPQGDIHPRPFGPWEATGASPTTRNLWAYRRSAKRDALASFGSARSGISMPQLSDLTATALGHSARDVMLAEARRC